MPHSDFVPKGHSKFATWHTQLKNSANEVAAEPGITADDLAMLAADNTNYYDRIREADVAAALAKSATTKKNDTRRTAEKNARAFARHVKQHPAFTEAPAAKLGIDGSGKGALSLATQAAHEAKPKLRGKPVATGTAEIKFSKKNAEAVNIYSKYEEDAEFTLLGRFSYSPIKDHRPPRQPGKPEKRLYIGIYVSHDKEYGQPSDIITVVCSG